MNYLKKSMVLVISAAMVFSLASCGNSTSDTTTGSKSASEESKTNASSKATTFIAAHASTEESTLGQFFYPYRIIWKKIQMI